jgi:hypothetical protein
LDTKHFDALVRRLPSVASRRSALTTVVALSFSLVSAHVRPDLATAKKRHRKHKKRKKKNSGCQAGTITCGAACCPQANCIAGSCCAAEQTCGSVCCPAGQRCGNAATGTCVAGQGTCATGASTCAANTVITCNGNNECACFQATDGSTRCGQPISGISPSDCGDCTTDADCRLIFPGVVGVFCGANATNICGCPAGQNVCGAPCPTL